MTGKIRFGDKRGQIEKVIETFPVMLLIFLIMGVFVFLSFSARVIKEPVKPGIVLDNNIGRENILLKDVFINGNRYLIFDALFLIGNNVVFAQQNDKEKEFYSKFTPELVKLAEDKCLILSSSKVYIFFHKGIFDNGNRDKVVFDYKDNIPLPQVPQSQLKQLE